MSDSANHSLLDMVESQKKTSKFTPDEKKIWKNYVMLC